MEIKEGQDYLTSGGLRVHFLQRDGKFYGIVNHRGPQSVDEIFDQFKGKMLQVFTWDAQGRHNCEEPHGTCALDVVSEAKSSEQLSDDYKQAMEDAFEAVFQVSKDYETNGKTWTALGDVGRRMREIYPDLGKGTFKKYENAAGMEEVNVGGLYEALSKLFGEALRQHDQSQEWGDYSRWPREDKPTRH
jgi:hypothetical protein